MATQGIRMTASAEEPAVAGSSSSSVPVGDGLAGSLVDPPPSSSEDERDHEGAVLGDEVDGLRDMDYFSSSDDDDYAYAYATGNDDVDSDSEFEEEEDDEVPQKAKNGVLTGVAAAPCKFLGQPARMATVESTVCIVSLATSSAPPCRQCHHGGGGEIIVDYRYTRFLRTQGGGDGDGVDMHILGPKQARLRFVLASPLASDSDPVTPVRGTLRLAGAVLASLVYPARFSEQLQTLWRVATAGALVPARATCLLVTADVGILRPGDFTAARMSSMCEEMQSVAGESAATAALLPAAAFDVAAELRLPAVLVGSEDDVRPTKRRRVTGEDCPICCEVLEEGLAAWPRCSHIFHAGCLEQHLVRGRQECPMCRSELKLSPSPCHTLYPGGQVDSE